MAKKILAFGDVHIQRHNSQAVAIFKRACEIIEPDITICTGDLLDCGQFSAHAPIFGEEESDYHEDLDIARDLLDHVQACTKERTVCIEGNHEYRLDRWAAEHAQRRGLYRMLAPRIQLAKTLHGDQRKKFTYVPHGNENGRYPIYRVNSRVMAVHGWSYAVNATKEHLRKSQGMSVLHGHTHRADKVAFPRLHGSGTQWACSTMCLCQLVPMYAVGKVVEWVNGFVVGYLGRTSETIHGVTIEGDRAILPDGTEVAA